LSASIVYIAIWVANEKIFKLVERLTQFGAQGI